MSKELNGGVEIIESTPSLELSRRGGCVGCGIGVLGVGAELLFGALVALPLSSFNDYPFIYNCMFTMVLMGAPSLLGSYFLFKEKSAKDMTIDV